jgi:hypothetical protein
MGFPVRHYHQTEVEKAVALEKCTTFEIKTSKKVRRRDDKAFVAVDGRRWNG